MTEKQIESAIISYLKILPNCLPMKINTVGIFDPVRNRYRRPSKHVLRGTSDILVCYYGIFVAIEVKKKNGRLSVYQKDFLQLVENNGGVAGVAYGIEDALSILNRAKAISRRESGRAQQKDAID
jgi:hypothetical protein